MHMCLCVCGFAPGPLSPLCLRQDFSCLRCGGIICFDFNREGCWCWWCVRGLFLLFSLILTHFTPHLLRSLSHTHTSPSFLLFFYPIFLPPLTTPFEMRRREGKQRQRQHQQRGEERGEWWVNTTNNLMGTERERRSERGRDREGDREKEELRPDANPQPTGHLLLLLSRQLSYASTASLIHPRHRKVNRTFWPPSPCFILRTCFDCPHIVSTSPPWQAHTVAS